MTEHVAAAPQSQARLSFWRNLQLMLVITRREIRDQLRDWRIILPVITLTLIFPALMNFTAKQAVDFVQRYNAPVIGERLVPFLLMIVGFFPISVSLVIALESFVGEKERRSIEPLLCSPLSDAQLYLGKLLAALTPPLLASYLGIGVYLIGVYTQVEWRPSPTLLAQIYLLSTVQAVVMVSGAIVASTQTTSVRAANLLASFIIIPMAFLIQGEAMVMFWANYSVLWWAILGQVLIAGLLIRTGLAYFNREELLGREIDILNLGWMWGVFRRSFTSGQRSLWGWYRRGVLYDLVELRSALLVTLIALLMGIYAGVQAAQQFPMPPEIIPAGRLTGNFYLELQKLGFISPLGAGLIWLQNLRVLALATFLGMFTFGVLGLLLMMLPIGMIAYITVSVAAAGFSPVTFLLALVAPHGVVEIPAILIGGAAILNLGATLTRPAQGKTLGEAFLQGAARWARIMLGVVLPLFLLAALLEVFITPRVAQILLGGL
ncbi:MAG: stage II sporulation protein M [Anaerolineales bacterium]|nr:stage II sporulation protein M [Anaerolineales bacterium]